MKRSVEDVVLHGMIAGFLAGAVVAGWFLIVDSIVGVPLRTPNTLGRILFGDVASGPILTFLYSLVHFGTFVVLGVAASGLVRVTQASPGWLLGLVFGIGVLNTVHYTGLLLTGNEVLTVLAWPHIVGANLAAGLVLMSYLHHALRSERPLGIGALRSQPALVEGLVTGLIGAGVVALWFFVLDIVAGQPFRTPAALGSAVFLGAEAGSTVQIDVGIIAAYTLAHLLVFGIAGLILVVVAREVERLPGLGYFALLAFIVLEAVSFGALVAFGQWVMGDLSILAVGIGNILAVLSMVGWLWRNHPALRERLAQSGYPSTA